MKRTIDLKVDEILNSILLANTGSPKNELFVDFINSIFGNKLLGMLLSELEKLLIEIISNDLAELKVHCFREKDEINFTLSVEEFNKKNIDEDEFLKTELVMIRRIKQIIDTIDIKLCFEGWSKKLFEDYNLAIEDYQIASELFKEKPNKEDLIIHCLVYLFDNEAIAIENEMLGK